MKTFQASLGGFLNLSQSCRPVWTKPGPRLGPSLLPQENHRVSSGLAVNGPSAGHYFQRLLGNARSVYLLDALFFIVD